MTALLQVSGLVWRKEGRKLLDIPQLEIGRGERLALIGSNGAGKSSLVKILAQLEQPSEGSVSYPAYGQESPLEIRRRMSLVFQQANLLKGSVLQNVALGLKVRGVRREKRENLARHWLKVFSIEDLAHRPIEDLSGGEAQRVSLARALATQPDLLFLDEPFSALDVPSRSSLLMELSTIIQNEGIAQVFITHHPAEIPLMAQKVLVMEGGRIIESGPPRAILEAPQDSRTARLVGIENILQGRWLVEGLLLEGRILLKGIPVNSTLVGQERPVFVKADLVRPARPEEREDSSPFQIARIIPLHDTYRLISADQPRPLIMDLNRKAFLEMEPREGTRIQVCIPPEALLLPNEADNKGKEANL